jgi:uncharacterized protein YqeY
MPLKEQLSNDLKDAMRAGDDVRRDTIRLALSSVHNAEIQAGAELDDDGVLGVLTKEAKQRRESIEEYGKANRVDLVQQETEELAIIEAYLPKQMTRDEVAAEARAVISETGAAGPADKNKVMPAIIARTKGRADGRLVNEVVTELLSGG